MILTSHDGNSIEKLPFMVNIMRNMEVKEQEERGWKKEDEFLDEY